MYKGVNVLKKVLALLLALCLIPSIAWAEAENKPTIYIFGDGWAAQWGGELKGFFTDGVEIVNGAAHGGLLSEIFKHSLYNKVEKGDLVILSYGVMAKDYKSESIPLYKPCLEKAYKELTERGAGVVFASVCTSRIYNVATGKINETKNYFTETTKAYAAEIGAEYVDLSKATFEMLSKLGTADSGRLYDGDMALGEKGKKLCAAETAEALRRAGMMTDFEKCGMSICYEPKANEKKIVFDTFVEANYCDGFNVYVKNGKNASVNYVPLSDGDSKIATSKSDSVTVAFSSADMIQIAPVYKFDANVDTKEKPFEIEMRNGVYDITVQKSEPLRGSVLADGFVIASNLDMPGTEKVTECASHTFEKYHIAGEKTEISVKGLTTLLKSVEVSESEVIFDKKPRIFIGGDSTVCNYYPLERTGEEKDGTVMTGWGQLLSTHTDSDVVNLAVSGDWAANWKKESFPIVLKEGEKGDIFILQFGINDHDKSSIGEMTEALSYMIDEAAKKGMIPILVSPQISAGYGWGDTSELGKSDGGAYKEFFGAVRSLAEKNGCFYVDLTDLSAGWFSELGREEVYKKYHIWDYENNCPKDMMHLSYRGASTMCGFFVSELMRMQKAGERDVWGGDLSKLTLW